MAKGSAGSAVTLILIGLIFQVISVILLFAVGLYVLTLPVPGWFGGILLLLTLLSVIWLVLVYYLSYERARDDDFEGARTPTLVFGLLALISGGIVSGVLFIVAYVKLGDAAEEVYTTEDDEAQRWGSPSAPVGSPLYRPTLASSSPAVPAPPIAPAPASLSPGSNFCSNCGRPTPPQARFCRNCGTQLQPA